MTAIGNAVVPVVGEFLGRLILYTEENFPWN